MVIPVPSYVTDYRPGSGPRRAPRSWLHSDAPRLSLNGDWRFRLSPTARVDEAAAAPDFDDQDWDTLPVPSHWVLHGDGKYGRPAYTNVQYPFPIDPPHVPDENPTGDHRRTFTLPDWDVETIVLRFDGVESIFKVWLNGTEVGVGKGSRLATEFDVTDLVRPGENVIMVRVHQWSSMSYLEDQDQWWLPGIFRDVTLLGRPRGGIEDVWLRTAYDHETGVGTVTPELVAHPTAFPVTVEIPELGIGQIYRSAEDLAPIVLPQVEPWSAERPRRYTATVRSTAEQVELQVGFRTVRIDGERLLVNGRQVIFHGVNRHETHPERGRVFDEAHARADMITMKRHNVNAIRTSHYPPHPRVLELADELGFWVIDECDLETHGFGYLGWQGNPSDDPAWRDAYLDRVARTVERDKNRPSVIIWSLGNESGSGANLAAMAQWIRSRDPERPVHYEGDYTGSYTDVYSRMYPSLVEMASILSDSGEIMGCGPAEAQRVRRLPYLLCEYVHAMGNGPGAIADYEAFLEVSPRYHGGFVWEWRDHGLLTKTDDGTPYYGYGGDFGEVVHDGNFVMDGLVLPNDRPSPGLAEFAAVSQPLRFVRDGATLIIKSRYHSADLAGLRVRALLETDGETAVDVELSVPELAPGGEVTVELPEKLITADGGGEAWLSVLAELAGATPWADAGHVVARAQWPLSEPAAPAPVPVRAAEAVPATETVELGPAVFDATTGSLTSLHGVPVAGPQLELFRGPTDNDRSSSRGSYELGAPEDTRGEGTKGPSSAERWRQRGLDRLVHRVLAVTASVTGLTTRVRVSAANSGRFVDVDYLWTLAAGELSLRVDLTPSQGWDSTWPRVGVRFDLPADCEHADWFGTGPLESYPDSTVAARVGRFSGSVDELNVVYSRPQETGHRAELRDLAVGTGETVRLRVATRPDQVGHRPGFTLTRHTPQDLDRAAHPYQLPSNAAIYLYVDNAVHGLGSRSCGIDVLPQHALWPGAHTFTLTFPAP